MCGFWFWLFQEQVNLKAIPGKKKPPKEEPEKKVEETDKDSEGRLFPKRKRPELQKMPEKKPPPEKEPKGRGCLCILSGPPRSAIDVDLITC